MPNDTIPDGADRLFILCAALIKTDPDKTAFSAMQGYRVCANEDEAKGSFFDAVRVEKPGFYIADLLCMPVPATAIRKLMESSDGE